MSKSNTTSILTATKLRLILSASLVLIILGMATGFYFAYSFLGQTAKSAADAQAEALSSDAKLQNLRQLEQQLNQHENTIQIAQQIVAESQSYMYQNQIINDITNYARQAGLSVSSITFPSSGSDSKAQTAPPQATPAPDGTPAASGTPATAPVATSTLKSVQASIQLGDDTNYNSLLHFVHLVEQNLTRMQISDLSLSGGSGESGGGSAQNLNIEVYIK